MSLADQIISAKSGPSYSVDELGVPDAVKNIDYYVARAIKLNPYLHTENGVLLNVHTEVLPKTADIVVLTKSLKMTANMAVLIHARLVELVPKLSEACIAITPHLLWNRETGKLEETEDEIPVDSPWN